MFVLNVCGMQAKSLSMDPVVFKSGLSPVHPILLTVFSCYLKLYIHKGQNLRTAWRTPRGLYHTQTYTFET
jgi:hypothetical protein